MRKLKALTLILLLTATGSISAVDLTQWKYYAQLNLEPGVHEYYNLSLTPTVYNVARPDLADIRLIDSDEHQIPYVLAKPRDITARHRYSPDVINRAINADGDSLVTLDFGQQAVKNSIEVETGGNNFRRAVKVEGSNDNIMFFTLVKQAYVFAIGDKADSRFSTIDLPRNDYRYLRVAVKPMASEVKSPVIEAARTFKLDSTITPRTMVEMVRLKHMEDEKNKSSVYEYDLEFQNLPISEFQLNIDDDSFYRHVTIQGRNAATRKVRIDSEDNRPRFKEVQVNWKSIAAGTIYKYIDADGKKRERSTLSIPSGRGIYRYLRIMIRNYDDKPLLLASASAKMITHQLIFAPDSNTPPKLYVGSESASRPHYDLKHRLSQPLQVKAATCTLVHITDNPLFGKVPQKTVAWTERHKALLLIALGLVVLVLGSIIFKSLRSIRNEQGQN